MGDKKFADKDVDSLTKKEIDERREATLYHLSEARRLWRGLRRLSEEERKNSPGKALSTLAAPLGALFNALSADADGKRPAVARAFDILGEKDGGVDPDRFEAELLALRLYRGQAEQEIVEALDDMSRHFADDVLDVGEMVVGPGLLALELARTVAKSSEAHASALSPVLDRFRDLTKKARKAAEDRRNAVIEAEKKPADQPAEK